MQRPSLSRFVAFVRRHRRIADVLLLVTVFLVVGAWQTRKHLGSIPAPLTPLQTLEGGAFGAGQLSGKPTVLVFWAPWCSVCRLEASNVRWVGQLVGSRAQVVSVATAYSGLQDVRRFAEENDVRGPILLDSTGGVAAAFRVESFPTVYFLDAQGRIKRSAVGYTTTLGILARLWL